MNKLADAILAALNDGIELRFRRSLQARLTTITATRIEPNGTHRFIDWCLGDLELSFGIELGLVRAVEKCHRELLSPILQDQGTAGGSKAENG